MSASSSTSSPSNFMTTTDRYKLTALMSFSALDMIENDVISHLQNCQKSGSPIVRFKEENTGIPVINDHLSQYWIWEEISEIRMVYNDNIKHTNEMVRLYTKNGDIADAESNDRIESAFQYAQLGPIFETLVDKIVKTVRIADILMNTECLPQVKKKLDGTPIPIEGVKLELPNFSCNQFQVIQLTKKEYPSHFSCLKDLNDHIQWASEAMVVKLMPFSEAGKEQFLKTVANLPTTTGDYSVTDPTSAFSSTNSNRVSINQSEDPRSFYHPAREAPAPIKILDDCLISTVLLENEVHEKLSTIVNVYNKNVDLVNKLLEKQRDHENRIHLNDKDPEDIHLVKILGLSLNFLSKKIHRIMKTSAQNFELSRLNFMPGHSGHTIPTLKEKYDSEVINLEKHSVVQKTPESSSASIQFVVQKPLPPHQFLGACFAPNWEKEPVLFTQKGNSGWICDLPEEVKVGKYVILDNKLKVLHWEKGNDHAFTPNPTLNF